MTGTSIYLKAESLDGFKVTVQQIAQLLLKECRVIFLSGPLGAGKTEFARTWLREAGVTGRIKSPSFSIIESYENTIYGKIHHLDLFRMNSADDFRCLGIEEYLDDRLIIEWPEKGGGVIVKHDLEISIMVEGETRVIECKSHDTKMMNKLRSMQLNRHENKQ